MGFIDGQRELYEKGHVSWQEFKAIAENIVALYKSGTPEASQKISALSLKECAEKAKAYKASAENLTAFHRKIFDNKANAAQEQASFTTAATWTLIVVAVLFGLGVSLLVAVSTSRELKAISAGLIENVSEVSGTASDLTAAAAALSAAASTQASSIQETAASIEEIRAMVQRNTESTVESARLSEQSKEQAHSGQISVNDMIAAMADITESNRSIQQEIEAGNKRISEIIKIIAEIESKTNVINDIVFQTKLLSFNASVEAARAGEHGKGFAVVAEEIGNLANMSGHAAKEITALLSRSTQTVESIVRETTTRVRSLMDQAEGKLGRGSEVAEACGTVLEKIVVNVGDLTENVQSIASASQEQSAGVAEIGKAIQLLEHSTNVNALETENTAASAKHLGEQVNGLNQGIFRLQRLITGRSNSSGTIVNAFVWRERYALGVPAMDDEHKILIEKINDLVAGVNDGRPIHDLKALFTDLAEFTKKHFADEENYMASISYPQLANHKIIHRKLLEKVGEFGTQFDSGNLDSSRLVSFLNDWLVKHILGVDMRYAKFSKTGTSEEIITDAA